MTNGLARVTISAPQRRVDVALSEQVPLAELLPDVLWHAGEGLADDGERHGGWVLRRTDGALLATAQALLPQGVRDGEVLHLVPARAHWPELEYDDVVEAIADGARRRGGAWSPTATRTAGLAGAAVPLAVGLLALLAGGPAHRGGWLAAAVVAVLLTVAGTVASRANGDGAAGATLGGYAQPYAFVAGALAVGSGDPVGLFGPVRWVGAPELLAGSVALLLVTLLGLLGLLGVASRLRVFVAGVTVGLVGAGAALGGLLLAPAGTAAVLLSTLVFAVGAIPLLAIRLGKLPLPPITLPAATPAAEPERARDLPDRSRVHAAVTRTEEMLTGMLLGHALLAVAAAAVLGVAGGTAGPVLVAVTSAVLLLRSRLFVALRHRVPTVLAGLAGYAVLGTVLVGRADDAGRLALVLGGAALVLGGAALALVAVAAGTGYARRPVSPYLGRIADLTDTRWWSPWCRSPVRCSTCTTGPGGCSVERPTGPARQRSSVGGFAARLGVARPLVGGVDLGLGLGTADPGRALHRLAGLQVLVHLEEVLDLQPVELAQVVDVAQVLLAGVLVGHAEDLVVAALFVRHPEHADGAAADQAAREGRLGDQHQGVQRVAVLAQRALNEPVVRRVLGGREEGAVQPDPAGRVVHLVLVPVTLGDLNRHVEIHLHAPSSAHAG
ncbi:type VII secretion integral membrane protein EccD [Micromonospora cremea]|uniref:Type VII secretion integral membrane protein EccD n=1 Tax=Micromonospora cremea TaxID=709881 RepID=A0A1N5ZU57_9ACTN|nr:type VII secretion integral membrane protein EccD [Micromonospora cremea]